MVCALLLLVCGAAPAGAGAQTIEPAGLGSEVSALVSGTAGEWTAHELADGQLIDPVLGEGAGSYGQGMTGGAMIEAGSGAPGGGALVQAGLNAELDELAHPDGGGFELLSLSEDYAYNQAHLGGDAAWQADRPQFAAFLSGHGPLISDAGVCYTTTNCYDNLKLVAAVADLALLRTGLGSSGPGTLLSAPHTLRLGALAKLSAAAGNTGSDASRSGTTSFTDAGILSDPAQNPLAYHALSTLMLGHAVVALGAATPHLLRSAFVRAARALTGLMTPDGDVAYIGRGQGQVWTVAATVDALSLAAGLTVEAKWRGRYLAGAQLALERLEAVYPRTGWGLPVVPRLAATTTPPNYLGIDGYANTVEYNGLALWALRDAAIALGPIPATPAQQVPSQTQGTFLDPSHTRFAAVTHGGLWFAVHATDSNLADERYGFGLVAAELYDGHGWISALPLRPLTYAPEVGGVAERLRGRTLYPVGETVTANATGVIEVRGHWGQAHVPRRQLTSWIFRPDGGEGVIESFRAQPYAGYQFQVWFEQGALARVARNGLHVREPNGFTQSYLFNVPVRVRAAGTAHSAYAEQLESAIITVPASRLGRTITYTTVL